MYCWVSAVRWATPTEDAKLMLLYSGTGANEARRIAREAAAEGIYAKVIAKAMDNQTLFHFAAPSFSPRIRDKKTTAAKPA